MLFALLFAQVARAAQAAPAATNAPRHAILFQNGDLLFGSLESITGEAGVRWRRADVPEPIDFAANNVAQIHLGRAPAPAFPPKDACAVRLRNGDELEGNLVSLDAKELKLSTWYAGQLAIPRANVELISPLPVQLATVFDGFTGVKGWTMGKVNAPTGEAGEWKYLDGAIYANEAASIAADLKLPGMMTMEFDLAWRGTLNIALALFTDSLEPISLRTKENEPKFGAFYSLQINSFSVNLLAINQQDPLRSLGSAIVPAFNQKNSSRLAIKVNKERRSILLFVDGQLIKEWMDAEVFSGEGSGVRIVHQGQGSARISNFRISEWDGRLEQRPQPRKEAKDDLALLLNGDRLQGTLHSVRDGKASFTMGPRTVEVPLPRVMHLDLAGERTEAPEPPESVRAEFARKGGLTLTLERWESDRAAASSPLLGKLTFDPRAFSRIQFKPSSAKGER
ncbi:MAG: hypothetical protein AB1705_03730 [Verrucomicrobiota bacterium]